MPSADTTLLDADELMHLALREAAQDDNEKAIVLLKQAINIAPQYGKAYYLLGALHAEIGLYDRAIEELQQAIELDADIPTASFQLGLLHITAGRIDEADLAWQALDKLGDDDPLFLFKRGLLQLAQNDYASCIDDLMRGIELNTTNPNLNVDMQRIVDNANQLQASSVSAESDTVKEESSGRQDLLDAYQRNRFENDD